MALELNPMEQFKVSYEDPIISMSLGNFDISLNNATLTIIGVTVFIVAFFILALKKGTLVPSRLQMIGELLHNFVVGMVKENAGSDARPFTPFIFALFMLLLVANLYGLIPGSFSITSHFINSIILAMAIFVITTTIGFARHGLGYLRMFFPHGVPIIMAPLLIPVEIISYIARPITLTLRLFANITAGHAMLLMFGGFVASLAGAGWLAPLGIAPFILDIILVPFELFVAVVQAYVFALLACIYFHDAYYMH